MPGGVGRTVACQLRRSLLIVVKRSDLGNLLTSFAQAKPEERMVRAPKTGGSLVMMKPASDRTAGGRCSCPSRRGRRNRWSQQYPNAGRPQRRHHGVHRTGHPGATRPRQVTSTCSTARRVQRGFRGASRGLRDQENIKRRRPKGAGRSCRSSTAAKDLPVRRASRCQGGCWS